MRPPRKRPASWAPVRSFAPSRALSSASQPSPRRSVFGVARRRAAPPRATSVMLEVNGVSRPVTSWGNTVGDALHAAGVSVGSNDLVQPGTGEAVRDSDDRRAPQTVTVDSQTRTLADHGLVGRCDRGRPLRFVGRRPRRRPFLVGATGSPRSCRALATSSSRWMARRARSPARPGQDARAIRGPPASPRALPRPREHHDGRGRPLSSTSAAA